MSLNLTWTALPSRPALAGLLHFCGELKILLTQDNGSTPDYYPELMRHDPSTSPETLIKIL